MLELTFGEQVKIVLSRKDMTIKQLAEKIEERTGKKMSRQNLTQRLSRDNFQEQDMRMIASILECPFHLSIMEEQVDSVGNEHVFREKTRKDTNIDIMDAESEQLTLDLELDNEPAPQETEAEEVEAEEVADIPESYQEPVSNERDITIGELVDMQEEPVYMEESEETEEPVYEEDNGDVEEPEYEEEPEYTEPVAYEEKPEYEESVYEEPVYEEPVYEEPVYEEPEHNDVNEILEEVAAIEAEEKQAREEKEKEREKEQEKPRGWRAYLQRRKKKQPEPEYSVSQEEAEELTEEMPKEEQHQEEEQGYEEYVQENEQELEEEFSDTAQDWETPEDGYQEEENVGEINPYTGMEYESNSVRVHPKRIGYVQVYDRSDHQWTDMTEWAFLGYQERKKALLGKDYEPPIYLY